MTDEKFIPMDCPICNSFFFENAQEDEGRSEEQFCPKCGWKYDYEKVLFPNKRKRNELSLSEYRAWYNKKISETPSYNYLEANFQKESHRCPVCGKYLFREISSFEICPMCGWEDDNLMEKDPEKWAGSSNELCLKEFKARYLRYLEKNSNYCYRIDGFPEE